MTSFSLSFRIFAWSSKVASSSHFLSLLLSLSLFSLPLERDSGAIDESVDLTRTLHRLEKKIRSLEDARSELAAEKESLLVSELTLKQQMQEDQITSTEKILDLEMKKDTLSKQLEKLQFDFKIVSTDHSSTPPLSLVSIYFLSFVLSPLYQSSFSHRLPSTPSHPRRSSHSHTQTTPNPPSLK